ncbi:MAG: hypothetical protein HYU66_11900 [Armatimonadetes bacterium]|nr:hypothetical protein [Armatimonadota bacterium]
MHRRIRAVVTLCCCLCLAAAHAAEPPRTGLLLIAHGSPNPEWNAIASGVGDVVARRLLDEGRPFVSAFGFLEAAKPTIADGFRRLEAAGVSEVVAVPLFVCHSDHTGLDIPCVLGLSYDAETLAKLHEEGAALVRTKLPVTLAAPMSVGDLLPELLLDRVREVSRDPQQEAVLLVYHGSEIWDGLWRQAAGRVVDRLKAAGYQTVGQVAAATVKGRGPRIAQAAQELVGDRRRLIVAGIYVGWSGENVIAMAKAPWPQGVEVVGTRRALLPDDRVLQWVLTTAEAARQRRVVVPPEE